MRLLAELGANIDTPNNNGATPAYIAVECDHAEVVRLLAELGANVNTPNNDGFTPVFIAAQEGHVEVVRVLGSLKANVATPANNGQTPLAAATLGWQFDPALCCAKTRILLGAPVTVHDLKCRTGSTHTRKIRSELKAWSADAIEQHRVFCRTFLFGG